MSLVGTLGYRKKIDDVQWAQLMIRPGIKYSMTSNWKLVGGTAYYDRLDAENELRFYQGTINTWPLTQFVWIKNYFRVEERFSPNNDWEFLFRVRNRVTIELNVVHHVKKKITIPVSIEGFLSFGETASTSVERNRLRFFTGIDYKHYDKWNVKLLYAIQGNSENEEYFSKTDIIYRVRFYFYLKKSSYYRKK